MSTTTDARLLALRDRLTGQVLLGSNNVSYHLRERIGEGGQGWVFTANWDEPGGLLVIVKVLRPDAISKDALTRFQREAEVLRLLSTQGRPNPHIVRFYDHAVARMPSPIDREPLVLPFTVLEYVHGVTLEQVLEGSRGKGLPVERVRRLLRQVSQALDLVHQQKVVHRDLKPSNILLANEAGGEVAKVTDFGLVKLVEMNLQRTTTLAGASLGYAPPEQYEPGNKRVSVPTDVFSLAAIAFEMLAGRVAFPFRDHENPLLIVTRILNGPRPTLTSNDVSLAPELAARRDVIDRLDVELKRALQPDPDARHPTVSAFWSAVEPLLRAVTEPTSPGLPASGAIPAAAPAAATGEGSLAFLETVPAYGKSKNPTQQSGGAMSASPAAVSTEPRTSSSASIPRTSSNPSQPRMGATRPSAHPSGPPRSAEVRVREPLRESALPTAWSFRVVSRPLAPGVVRSAVFAPDGQTAVGIGPGGMARWDREWIGVALPGSIDTRLMRAIRRLRNGDVLLAGDRGNAVRLASSGVHEVWTLPDREANFYGLHVDERAGVFSLVGERPAKGGGTPTVGHVVQLVDGRVTFSADVAGSQRLRAATRVLSGALLACGEWGALARVENGKAELTGSLCGGNLLAIEAMPDGGAVTVGAGGHALYVSTRLEAQLEAVQTTKDIASVTVAQDGAAWAGAAQARLLRRRTDGWTRMNGELGLTSTILAVWAGERTVRAICDDGAMIEGQIS